MADTVAINELRWPVQIAQREQLPASGGGIDEVLVDCILVYAKIEALRPMTFYGAAQTDRPVTHMIWLRWLDWLDTTHVITRELRRLDGTPRREVFRIRRVKEMAGQQRFLEIEAELEHRE